MTLQQEAYHKIDRMTEEGIKILLELIDEDQAKPVSKFKIKGNQTQDLKSEKGTGSKASTDMKNVTGESKMEDKIGSVLAGDGDVLDFIDSLNADQIEKMTADEKRKLFLCSGGKISIDEDAVMALRERSMI